MPLSIGMEWHGGGCHLHIEHGSEEGDMGIRDSSARPRIIQVEREDVGASMVGADIECNCDQTVGSEDGGDPRRRDRSRPGCRMRGRGARFSSKRPEDIDQADTEEDNYPCYGCPAQDSGQRRGGINCWKQG